MAKEYRICVTCVMDTTDPNIVFDEAGRCNHCRDAERRLAQPPFSLSPQARSAELGARIDGIKRAGRGKRYDCIIGLSGGVDSSYLAYLVKREFGLRPLAVHLDNGWNSEISVSNIENICRSLDIDLHTHVIDWEQFRSLQLAFLRASTPDTEILSDHAIVTALYEAAAREGLRCIVGGTNFATESILPTAWSQGHVDWKYIKSVNRMFGGGKLDTFPCRSIYRHAYFRLVRGIEWFEILNYVDYRKDEAKSVISRELGWKDYGRKHGESKFTRIFQELILPDKFGYDKRRCHYSSLIVTGQMTRAEALKALETPLYEDEAVKKEDKNYLCSKLGLPPEELDAILAAPCRTITDYPSYARSRRFHRFMSAVRKAKARKP